MMKCKYRKRVLKLDYALFSIAHLTNWLLMLVLETMFVYHCF